MNDTFYFIKICLNYADDNFVIRNTVKIQSHDLQNILFKQIPKYPIYAREKAYI